MNRKINLELQELMNSEIKKISFNKSAETDFVSVLRERVNLYFKDTVVSHKANIAMCLKSVFLMSVAAVTYFTILSGFGGVIGLFGFYALLGFLISIGTMNISHDALHGAYVSRGWGNRVLGLFMDLFGASSFYWKKEHVVDHHSFTNIVEHDADLDVPFLLRLCPKAAHRAFHRFQHLYAPILYSLNIMNWVYHSDIERIYLIFRNKQIGPRPSNLEIFLMVAFKFVHVFLFLALPIFLLSLPWWQIVLAYMGYLCVAGITLTTIFQLAHIVENTSSPLLMMKE